MQLLVQNDAEMQCLVENDTELIAQPRGLTGRFRTLIGAAAAVVLFGTLGASLFQTHATRGIGAGPDKGSEQGFAAVGLEEAYHYDVEILSGDLEEQDIRDIYDLLFGVKVVDNVRDKGWGHTTSGVCVSFVDPPKSLGIESSEASEVCGQDKLKELYGNQFAHEHERPVGNKITVDGNVVSYQTCESTSGDEFGSSKSLQNDEKAWVTKSGTKLLIEKMEMSNFVEGSC